MKVLQFKTYSDYVKAQTETNKRKLGCIWTTNQDVAVISMYIRSHIPHATFGICHGVRNGWEVKQFRSALKGVEVIGTEISETANQFEHVVQWDFHEVTEEWLGSVDFIYSNSIDHSYNPVHCLDQWMRCLKPSGRCFIEWSSAANEIGLNEADCFVASFEEYREMIEANYAIESILPIAGSSFRRLLKRLKLTRTVSLGMPKKVMVIRHGRGDG